MAEANGLASDRDLRVGATVTIPNRVSGHHNDYKTFKPYDPGKLIGDTQPTMPVPKPDSGGGGGGCGGIGMIIVAVVAVVATVLTAGALAPVAAAAAGAAGTAGGLAGTMMTGAAILTGTATGISGMAAIGLSVAAGAIGSVVSQSVGMAIGAQSKFNWKGVAVSAAAAGVTSGVGTGMGGGSFFTVNNAASTAAVGAWGMAGRAVMSSVISQGIGVATGLQSQFNWTNVAAAGIGAGVGSAVGAQVFPNASDFSERLTRGFVSGAVGGVAASVLSGGKANYMQIAVDAFGNALGNSVLDEMAGMSGPSSQPIRVNDSARSGQQMLGSFDSLMPASYRPQGEMSSIPAFHDSQREVNWGALQDPPAQADVDAVVDAFYPREQRRFGGSVTVASSTGFDSQSVSLAMKELDAADGARYAELVGLKVNQAQLRRPRIGVLSELGERMLGMVDMTAGIAGGAVGYVYDSVLTSADAVSGGRLSANFDEFGYAVSRNRVRGQMLWNAGERIAGSGLRLATFNMGVDEAYQGVRDFFQIDRAMQLEASGDYRGAQALWGSMALNAAGGAAGATRILPGIAPMTTQAVRSTGVGLRLAVEDFGASRTGQILASAIDYRMAKSGFMLSAVPSSASFRLGGIGGGNFLPASVDAAASYITNKFPNDPFDSKGKIFGEVVVVDGKVTLGPGRNVPTAADFVISTDNRLLLGRSHMTLADKRDVLAAGQLKITGDGRLRVIDNQSGHYRPSVSEAMKFPELFRRLGVNLKDTRFQAWEFHSDADGFVIGRTLMINEIQKK